MLQWEIERLKNLTIKTLKTPEKQGKNKRTQTREESSNRGETNARASSRASQSSQYKGRDELDEEEDEWNQPGAWTRNGAKKPLPQTRGSKDAGPKSSDDENYQWKTSSEARSGDSNLGSKGRTPKKVIKGKGPHSQTEGDLILQKLAKGEKLKPAHWEGGGQVERASKKKPPSKGKGSWTPTGKS